MRRSGDGSVASGAPRTIPVVSAGSLVPDDFVGEVRSVHDRVVNIEATIGSAGPLFISLIADGGDMTDFALLLAGSDDLSRIRSLRAGTPVTARDRRVALATEIGTVSIAWNDAKRWTGRIDPATGEIDASVAAVASILRESGDGGLAPLLRTGSGNDPFVRCAAAILRDVERSSSFMPLSGLVGLGRGFTPSGDDFLAGLFLAARERGIDLEAERIVGDHLDRTTTGGRTLLSLTSRGFFPAYQIAFREALYAGAAPAAVSTLRDHGASSGTDMATGFCWFMDRQCDFCS